jgi:energy-coupling factor transport system permease protein
VGLVVFLSQIPPRFVLKGLKPILLFIVITGLFNLFLTSGEVIWRFGFLKITKEGVYIAVFMILRLTFLIVGTSLLTLTTSPIALTDGMEHLLKPFSRIGLPAHELSMMMSIALRFIPTLMEETDKIIKAQAARGADFESGNLIRKAKAMIPILVPLFISAFRRADELATAMECRCYNGGEHRTSLHELKFKRRDIGGLVVVVILTVAVILI